MPRRSTIPIPSLPNVSRVGPAARMDPNAAAAPGRAATSMLQTGLGITAELIQRRDAVKQTAAWDEFQSQKTIYNSTQNFADKAAVGAFDKASATGDPSDFNKIANNLATQREDERSLAFEKLKTMTSGLSKEQQAQAMLELNEISSDTALKQKAFEIYADKVRQVKTHEIAFTGLKQDYVNKIGDPGSEAEIAAIEKEMSKHMGSPEELDNLLSGLKAEARYDELTVIAKNSTTKDQLKYAQEQLDSSDNQLSRARTRAVQYVINSNLGSIYKDRVMYEAAVFEAQRTGKPMNPAIAEDLIERDVASKEEIEKVNKEVENTRIDLAGKNASEEYVNREFNNIFKEIEPLLKDPETSEKAEVSVNNWEKVEQRLNRIVTDPYARSIIKRRVLGTFLTITAVPDSAFFSDLMGQEIANLGNDEWVESASSDYQSMVTKIINFSKASGSDFPMFKWTTQLEVGLADLYRENKGVVTKQMKDDLYDRVHAGTAGEVIKESYIKQYNLIGNLGFQMKSERKTFDRGDDVGKAKSERDPLKDPKEGDILYNSKGESVTFKNGGWVTK
jgi:hypothetical protein